MCVVVFVCLTAEQVVQRAEFLSQRFHMFGGAEPARDQITEETVVFTHRLHTDMVHTQASVCFLFIDYGSAH